MTAGTTGTSSVPESVGMKVEWYLADGKANVCMNPGRHPVDPL